MLIHSTTSDPKTQQLSRRNLADQLTTAAAGLGYFATLTASHSQGRTPTSEHPKRLCEEVARSLAKRGVNSVVAHAFAPSNRYGIEVLHVHAFIDKPLPSDFARAWSREYGPASTDSRPINDSASSTSCLARYVAAQAGGIVAGWKSGGRVRTRSAALEDVSDLVDPASDPDPPIPPIALEQDNPDIPTEAPAVRLLAAISAGRILDTMEELRAEGYDNEAIGIAYTEAQALLIIQHPPRPPPLYPIALSVETTCRSTARNINNRATPLPPPRRRTRSSSQHRAPQPTLKGCAAPPKVCIVSARLHSPLHLQRRVRSRLQHGPSSRYIRLLQREH